MYSLSGGADGCDVNAGCTYGALELGPAPSPNDDCAIGNFVIDDDDNLAVAMFVVSRTLRILCSIKFVQHTFWLVLIPRFWRLVVQWNCAEEYRRRQLNVGGTFDADNKLKK
jgi:hypothetical protein